ncbi:hypothetical protein B0H16DRAFT_1386415 [Mycena metata]|uniref:Uncharacterized protein n=1 Tax=Mycena metata TaxID=1033252 RepID=A0AAD7MK14_9AGAR|nr:hypothetical protein B0H16DRAFT_1386415 [Mycena metata]
MLKIIAGERAKQPSDGSLPYSLWQDVTSYWAQDPTVRPTTQVENMNTAVERKTPSTAKPSDMHGRVKTRLQTLFRRDKPSKNVEHVLYIPIRSISYERALTQPRSRS